MNNSVKALLVISFNGGYQDLLEQHIPLGWSGLCRRMGRNEVFPEEGIFFEMEK